MSTAAVATNPAAINNTSSSDSTSSSSIFSPTASVWSTLLSRAHHKRDDFLSSASLILLGDRSTGKSALLNKFSDRTGNAAQRDYLIDYSVIGVKNRFNADKDEVLTQLNAWQLDEPTHADLITTALRANLQTLGNQTQNQNQSQNQSQNSPSTSTGPLPSASISAPPPSAVSSAVSQSSASSASPRSSGPYSLLFSQFPSVSLNFNVFESLKHSIFLIAIDLSEPWKAMETATKWLEVVSKFKDSMWPRLNAEEQKTLTDKISHTVQSYYNSDIRRSTAGLVDSKDSADSLIGEEKELNALNSSIPQINFGFPVVLVGTRSDAFARNLKDKSNTDERLDVLTKRLRILALKYGAALFFTSAAGRGAGVGVDLLQSYIYHRLFAFPMGSAQQPKAVASEEDYLLYIPAGFDSMDLINSTPSKLFPDSMTIEEIIKNPSRTGKSAASKLESIKAQDNVLFFKTLKFALENGTAGQTNAARQATNQSAAAELKAKVTAELKAAATNMAAAAQPAITITDPTGASKAAAAPSPTTAAAAASAASIKNPKGQIAVKQFFRSLLNNNPGTASSKDSAAAGAAKDPKIVRANAEKELRKMTGANE